MELKNQMKRGKGEGGYRDLIDRVIPSDSLQKKKGGRVNIVRHDSSGM